MYKMSVKYFEFKVQCRHQVLITTGIEVGHETGLRDD